MIDGVGSHPFSAITLPPVDDPPFSFVEQIQSTSRARYARNRVDVEAEVRANAERGVQQQSQSQQSQGGSNPSMHPGQGKKKKKKNRQGGEAPLLLGSPTASDDVADELDSGVDEDTDDSDSSVSSAPAPFVEPAPQHVPTPEPVLVVHQEPAYEHPMVEPLPQKSVAPVQPSAPSSVKNEPSSEQPTAGVSALRKALDEALARERTVHSSASMQDSSDLLQRLLQDDV
jgi:hypothetical protein